MVYFLYGLFFISCIVLVAAVLLQPGKTDAGALFTSNVSSSAFSPRGTTTILSKLTIAAAATFMLSALFLAMPAFTGNVSVLSSNPDQPTDSSANTNTNANTEAVVPTDANANASANTNTAADNSNSGLVQTPATDEIQKKAANAQAANANPNVKVVKMGDLANAKKAAANKGAAANK